MLWFHDFMRTLLDGLLPIALDDDCFILRRSPMCHRAQWDSPVMVCSTAGITVLSNSWGTVATERCISPEQASERDRCHSRQRLCRPSLCGLVRGGGEARSGL